MTLDVYGHVSKEIIAHEGPLMSTDRTYQGSPWNRQTDWENLFRWRAMSCKKGVMAECCYLTRSPSGYNQLHLAVAVTVACSFVEGMGTYHKS
jgi:hypothetical protein